MSGADADMGRAITERLRPRLTLADRRGRHARPGQLMRSTLSFGMRIGLSAQNRREYDTAVGAAASSVRPPIDYWPWPETGEQPVELRRSSRAGTSGAGTTVQRSPATTTAPTTSAAKARAKPVTAAEVKAWSKADEMKRMLTGKGFSPFDGFRAPETPAPASKQPQAAAAPAGVAPDVSPDDAAAAAARPVTIRRGLPLTPRRRGGTWAGPRTSPGGMANGAAPTPTVSVAPPRFTTLAPEPLPDVVRTGVVDTPEPRAARPTAAARPTPGGVAPTVSADDLARRLLTPAPSARPATPADRPSSPPTRPGGALSRAVAGATSAATAPAARRDPPARLPAAVDTDERSALRGAPQPRITAEALRRAIATEPAALPAPDRSAPDGSAPAGSAASVASTGAVPTAGRTTPLPAGPSAARTGQPTSARASGDGAPSPLPPTTGALPTAVGRVAGAGEALGSISALPVATEMLARVSAPSTVALMERSATADDAVDTSWFEHTAVVPPRTFGGWTEEAMAAEPSLAPLPLASLPRRAHPTTAIGTAPVAAMARHDIESGVRRTTSPVGSTTTPHVLARSLAAPGRERVTLGHRTRHTGSTSPAVGTPPAITRPSNPPGAAMPAPSRVHVGRRVVSRSADGRHLRWTPSADEPVDGQRFDGDGAGPPAVSSALAEQTPPRPPGGAPIDARAFAAFVAESGLVGDTGTNQQRSTAIPDDHILRRTLAAANEISATLGDLVVAPPAAGGFVPDAADDTVPVARSSAGADPSASVRREAARSTSPQQRHGGSAVRDSPATQPQHWVPAGPGTLFSTPSAGGMPVRRALLTMPEVLRSATAADITDAALTGGAPLQRSADVPPAGTANHRSVDPRPVDARRPSTVARGEAIADVTPIIHAEALPVAPRAVQRVDGPISGDRPSAVRRMSDPAPPREPRHPTPPAELAERFMAELARHRQERPKPLPVQFASIADLIVGKRRPLVSTSEASQRALAAVDKVAATTGDVIHLATPAALTRPTSEMHGIIAHELTHVAAPSPAPRFFADDRHSAEERRATEIGEIMRRSPAPPPSGSIASRGGSTRMTITEQHTRAAGTGAITSTTTSSSGGGSRGDTIRRALESAAPSSSASPASPVIRRALTDTATSSSTSSSSSSSGSSSSGGSYDLSDASGSITSEQFSRMLREHFDLIVELLEDRIGSDIERRGGRYRGGF